MYCGINHLATCQWRNIGYSLSRGEEFENKNSQV